MKVTRDSYCRCLFYSANALGRKITRIAEEEFRPVKLAPSLCFVLMTVNKQPGITAGEIADVMDLQPSTVTRLVDKLERDRYLVRQKEGKYMQIHPTAKSLHMDGQLRRSWKNLFERYTALLGVDESSALTAAIDTAARKLQ